jgi:hypothetical protein
MMSTPESVAPVAAVEEVKTDMSDMPAMPAMVVDKAAEPAAAVVS